MSVALFLLVRGIAAGGLYTPRWRNELRVEFGELALAYRPQEEGRRWVAWRLVGANNRELGRSAEVFDDIVACRAAIDHVRERIGAADAAVVLNDSSGLWTWRLAIDSKTVAAASRAYQRRRECSYNLAQFVGAASAAGIANEAVVLARGRVATLAHS